MSRRVNETRPARYDWADLLRLILLIGLATLLLPGLGVDTRTAAAQNRSVAYADFDVTLELQADGSYRVTERQVVSFTGGSYRNAFRSIPLTRTEGIGDVTITEVTGGDETPYEFVSPGAFAQQAGTYTAEVQGSEVRVDWSFPPTSNADRTFLVRYAVVGGLRVYAENEPPYQQISWMAIGPELTENVPVRVASLTITLPEPVTVDDIEYLPADDPPASSNDGQSWTWTAGNLAGGDFFERSLRFSPMVQAAAPPWQAASDEQEAREVAVEEQNAVVNVLALGIGLLALVGGGLGIFGLWYAKGRDPHTGVVAEFLPAPPDDLPPGVAGTLIDETASEHEFVATMVDLAKRGIIRINEESSGGIMGLGASRDFDLTLLDVDKPRAAFETDLLQAIFGHTLEATATVRLSEVKDRVDTARPAILNDLYEELVSRGYFPNSPEQTRGHWRTVGWVIAGGAIISGFILNGVVSGISSLVWLPIIVIALLGIVVVMFSGAFPKKTPAGAEAAARWLAFKRYLESIENYEDLNEAQGIFERYLPFAIAFHIDRSWVQKFAAVRAPAPEWYGDGGTVMMPGTYGPGGSFGRQRRRGGSVVFLPGGGWPGGGGGSPGGGMGTGGDGGGFDVPDLQGGSDAAGRSLQD
nr:DUF2207 domain-containing protein [Chloroflexia bacterium]